MRSGPGCRGGSGRPDRPVRAPGPRTPPERHRAHSDGGGRPLDRRSVRWHRCAHQQRRHHRRRRAADLLPRGLLRASHEDQCARCLSGIAHCAADHDRRRRRRDRQHRIHLGNPWSGQSGRIRRQQARRPRTHQGRRSRSTGDGCAGERGAARSHRDPHDRCHHRRHGRADKRNAEIHRAAQAPYGTIDDVAATVDYLTSADSRHLNGAGIVVDGGSTVA